MRVVTILVLVLLTRVYAYADVAGVTIASRSSSRTGSRSGAPAPTKSW
jgi:hypothetical protein